MRIARLERRPIGLRSAVLTALLATALLVIAQPARADVGETIILRCTHQESVSGFSQSAYRQALKELNADLEEYASECSSLIRQAQEAAAGARGSASGGGSSGSGAAAVAIAATPAEQRAITHAQSSSPEPVKLKGAIIHPGVVHVGIASALNSMPTPLLVILGFLLACLALVMGGALRKRVRARSSD
jgi:hypothetical protein